MGVTDASDVLRVSISFLIKSQIPVDRRDFGVFHTLIYQLHCVVEQLLKVNAMKPAPTTADVLYTIFLAS